MKVKPEVDPPIHERKRPHTGRGGVSPHTRLSNSTYGGNGGRSGPMNTAHIAAIEIIGLRPATR